jgi:outer membrane protein TolC
VSGYADDTSGADEEKDSDYNSSLSFSFTQPLLKGRGAEVNTIKIVTAQNNYENSLSKLRSTVSGIVADVMNAYWNLIQYRGTLEADQYALQLAYDLVESNEAQVRVGTLAPIEVLQAQSSAASREVQIISDEQTVRNQEDALRQLLNIPEHDPLWQAELIPTSELTVEAVNVSLDESIQIALENREEIVRQEILLENQALSLTSAQNALLPELDLQATFGLTGSETDLGGTFANMVEFDSYSAGISLSFSYPIGNQAAESSYQSAKLSYDQTLLSQQKLEQQIATQVRQAVRAVETSYQQIEAAGIAKQLAEEQLNAEQKKFNNGLSTNFKVLDFQESLASAQNKYTQAIVSYNKALIALDEALGLLLQRQNIVVNEME